MYLGRYPGLPRRYWVSRKLSRLVRILFCILLQMLGSSAGAREAERVGGGRAALSDVRGSLFVSVQRAEEAERDAGVCLQTSWWAVADAACGLVSSVSWKERDIPLVYL